jgi:hypothetical protein
MSNNNTGRRIANNFKGTSVFVKVLLVIILIIIIVLIIIWIFTLVNQKIKFNQNNPIILSGERTADTSQQKSNSYVISNLPTPLSGKLFSYSMWIYINDYTSKFGHYKNIISRSNKSSDYIKGKSKNPSNFLPGKNSQGSSGTGSNAYVSATPGIYLDASSTKLIALTDIIQGKSSKCEIQSIPLNKWNHIVYVLNQNSIDLYLNGKLERSCVLNGIPHTNKSDSLYIAKNDGFNGKVAQIQYFTEAINPDKVLQLYNRGPSGSNEFVLNDSKNKFSNINYDKLKNDICSGNGKDLSSLIESEFSKI